MSEDKKLEMAKELKSFTVPKIKLLGFSGTFPHFRRKANDRFDFLSFQFNRHGGSFVLESGFSTKDDLSDFAKTLPFTKLNYGHAHPKNRMRIKPDKIEQEDFWFEYHNFTRETQFQELAELVATLLPKVEQFLSQKH